MSDRRPENRRALQAATVWWNQVGMNLSIVELYEAVTDPVAVVRRGVESGTIKGEVVEACVVAWPPGHDTGITPLVVDRPGIYIVVGPVSDGGEDA